MHAHFNTVSACQNRCESILFIVSLLLYLLYIYCSLSHVVAFVMCSWGDGHRTKCDDGNYKGQTLHTEMFLYQTKLLLFHIPSIARLNSMAKQLRHTHKNSSIPIPFEIELVHLFRSFVKFSAVLLLLMTMRKKTMTKLTMTWKVAS